MAAGNSDGTAKPPGKPFKKGQSGNPNGRPKVNEEFRARCRAFVDSNVIQAWQSEVVAFGENWVKCAELLAAYGYGKPTQVVAGEGKDGAIEVIIRTVADAD